MGSISYDGMLVVVDDRTLAHLQIVIVNKLRRGDTFLMSWIDAPDVGSGRSSIWLHPYVLVHFKFDGSRAPSINETWLAALAESAESSRGLVVIAEHSDLPKLGRKRAVTKPMTVVEPADNEVFSGRPWPKT